jgi:Ca-activated chloride channel family protein
MSDGAANAGEDVSMVARIAAQERIPIDTVALGTPSGLIPNPDPFGSPVSVPPDPALMAQIAQLSHGRTFTAQSADELSSIYQHLGSDIGSIERSREVTAAFAIVGLALVLMAAVAATLLSPRVP